MEIRVSEVRGLGGRCDWILELRDMLVIGCSLWMWVAAMAVAVGRKVWRVVLEYLISKN